MNVLTLNVGSSSIKFAVFAGGAVEAELQGKVEFIGSDNAIFSFNNSESRGKRDLGQVDHEQAIGIVVGEISHKVGRQIDCIGHRVVHGGDKFGEPTLISPAVLDELSSISKLAPLHNPSNLAGVQACVRQFPHVPQVAVFDTAFHATLPELNHRYAVPNRWYQGYQVRKYGFHGISHAYVAARASEVFDLDPNDHSLLIAHLGNGCSVTAVRNGRSVDTSMGFTPLDGLVMGTRSGSIDPGVIFYMAREVGLSLEQLESALNRESGLIGLSGSSDMQELKQKVASGDEAALFAIRLFEHRLCQQIASLTASLNALPDALIFTGGIGENQAQLRESVLRQLSWMGFEIDLARNAESAAGARRISKSGTRFAAVIPTDEELAIAQICRGFAANF